jgi:hypothetical protein
VQRAMVYLKAMVHFSLLIQFSRYTLSVVAFMPASQTLLWDPAKLKMLGSMDQPTTKKRTALLGCPCDFAPAWRRRPKYAWRWSALLRCLGLARPVPLGHMLVGGGADGRLCVTAWTGVAGLRA